MIREATAADVPRLVSLGTLMHDESPRFRERPFNPMKVATLAHNLIAAPDGLVLVVERDGGIVGGFLGMVFDDWAHDDRVSTDFALYVHPDMRGSTLALRLLKRYREWAVSRGASEINGGATTGIAPEVAAGLYRAAGFQPAGQLFEFKGA